ncbi:mechanosensitive ion channel protein 7-like [Vicia villosa]|uniref:mechanosensitive ion channel protein 7-like n=1 Tax=Vicia villosa TaxID=3911 RepID=UPI00273B8239|nr:mechanosensitive ion channel protein 7-like [Vicia villosa]
MQVKDVVINIDENREMSEIQGENVQTSFVGESSSNAQSSLKDENHSSEISEIKGETVQTSFFGESSSNAQSSFINENHSSMYKKRKFSLLILFGRLDLILIPALLLTLTFRYLRNMNLWEVRLWKYEVLILFLVSGSFLAHCIIRIIIVFFIKRKFHLEIKLVYYVYTLKKTIQKFLWLLLLAWSLWFYKPLHREVICVLMLYMEKALFSSLFLAPALWLFKTLIAEILTTHFYATAYCGKIEESFVNHSLINMLSGPHMVELRRAKAQEDERLAAPNFSTIIIERSRSEIEYGGRLTLNLLHKLNPKFVSSLEMNSFMKTFTYRAFDLEDDHSALASTEKETKAATEQIFRNLDLCGSRSIEIEDLMSFMIETEAAQIVNHFKRGSDSGKVSQTALKDWILSVFRERITLSLRINDTKSPVPKLYNFLNFLVVLLISVISILILEMVTIKLLGFVFASQFVFASLIFGSSLKTVFEGIFFVFIMHYYDVGDKCVIDDIVMTVEKINILTTVFIRFDKKRINMPNSVLHKKKIRNCNRCTNMEKALQFCIHIATQNEKVFLMKQRIKDFMEGKLEYWHPSPTIKLYDNQMLDMVKVVVWPTFRNNIQNMEDRCIMRSLLIEELMMIFRYLEIVYWMPLNFKAFPITQDCLPVSFWTTTTK